MLHVHDYRERNLRADPQASTIRLVRFRCASCAAIWRILPRFVALRYWRTWRVIEVQTLSAPAPHSHPTVPRRTVGRWTARLGCAASWLTEVVLRALGSVLPPAPPIDGLATRADVALAYAQAASVPVGLRLAHLGALAHRQRPGLRVM